jgi:hypothetical protein
MGAVNPVYNMKNRNLQAYLANKAATSTVKHPQDMAPLKLKQV